MFLIWSDLVRKNGAKDQAALEDRSAVLVIKRRPGLRQGLEVHLVFIPRHVSQEDADLDHCPVQSAPLLPWPVRSNRN